MSYLGVCARMYVHGDASIYTGTTVYLISFIAFFKLGLAIYGWIITKHMEEPIVSALKKISFIDALVSIVIT